MTIVTHDFESGSNGATVDVGDEGGAVTAVSASKATYATAAAFTSSTLGMQSSGLQWAEFAAPATDFSFSFYCKQTTNPGSGSSRIMTFRDAGATVGSLRTHSSTALALVNSANVAVSGGTASVTWAPGDDFRFDVQMNDTGADVAVTWRIFKGANVDGTTPDDTVSGTLTGVSVSSLRIGSIDAGSWVLYADNLSLSDALEWIGPYVPAVTPLDDPVVTVTVEDSPSTPAATDGSITITWPAVSGADHYVAGIASGHDVTTGFTVDDATATSPHTYTGLGAGNYTVAVKAAAA